MSEIKIPNPVLDSKEMKSLNDLTNTYKKLTEPGVIHKAINATGKLIPEQIKQGISNIGLSISQQQLYSQMMNIITEGFKIVEQTASKISISEESILKNIEKEYEIKLGSIEQITLLRSYQINKLQNQETTNNLILSLLEGGATGAAGFAGIPFNIVLSTFLYFRAVQNVAMYYGYDTKNDSSELIIASEVFTQALSPESNSFDNQFTNIIGKVMLFSTATTVKQTAKKTWSDMIAKKGVPLFIAQLRALAHKSAQKALQKAGEKGLENSIFRETFEQIGKKLTLKAVQRGVPIVAGVIGALIDTYQMNKILIYANIFYQKRFILEKESRIQSLFNEPTVTVQIKKQ